MKNINHKNNNKFIYFECDCIGKCHQLEIEEFDIDKDCYLSICMYKHRSDKTGKLLKNRQLIADIVLNPQNTERFKQCLK